MLVKWTEHTTNPDKPVIYLFSWAHLYIHVHGNDRYVRLDIKSGERVEYDMSNIELTRFYINNALIPTLCDIKVQILDELRILVKRHRTPPKIIKYVDVTNITNISLLLRSVD